MRSGEEIQSALRAFVTRWRDWDGTERSGAQNFLADLFAAYGVDLMKDGPKLEDAQASEGIMDLYWQDHCIIEMKAPAEKDRIERHHKQAHDYWYHSGDSARDIAAPPYLVLCAFQRIQVWEPGRYPNAKTPRIDLSLDELPDRYEALQFLIGQEPLFQRADRALTTEATAQLVALLDLLQAREAAPVTEIQLFTLQLVWCLFAERLGLLQGHPVERTLQMIGQQGPGLSAPLFNQLFAVLNEPASHNRTGDYAGVPYANGGLFERPTRVMLNADELALVGEIAGYDWSKVNPTIFGSLMEGYFHRGTRSEMGAHYTHEVDILKIVEPTIVEPWQARIAATTSVDEAREVLEQLCQFRVLDPACGCGNFLYVAYRKLRDLEAAAKQRIHELARSTGVQAPAKEDLSYFPISNMFGVELQIFSVLLSRVTLWMGHKLAADEHGMAEPVLPLVDLSSIVQGDALKLEWPQVDAVIGNPPFNGSQWLRGSLGDEYVEWLKREFKCGIKDYCVYWFRKAHDHLPDGGRAGLVGTNSISQNRARSASLDYIVANGGVITNAVSTQKWPGEAKVHVSLVNWTKNSVRPVGVSMLDGLSVSGISPELRSYERSAAGARRLEANRGICFQGPIPVGEGFVLTVAKAAELLQRAEADYGMVVKPYLMGEDIAEDPAQSPRRWIVDFGDMPLERASDFPAALEIVMASVKPQRETNKRPARRERWWQFGEKALGMRRGIAPLERYLTFPRVGKRLSVSWGDPTWVPGDKAVIVCRSDDYSAGVMCSSAHDGWAWARAGTLKADLSYTPTSVFETFPWPDPTEAQREKIGELAKQIVARRQEICVDEQFGLTELYNRVDDGAYRDLKKLHSDLDEAVAEAYGWPKSVAHDPDEIVRRLLALNLEIAAGTREYDPFGKKNVDRAMVLPE